MEIIERRFDALYETDSSGRLLGTNEWDQRPAPRFHLMRTAHGLAARYRNDVPDALVASLEEIIVANAPIGLDRLPSQAEAFQAALNGDCPVERVWSGPAYVFGALPASPNEVVTVGAGNADVLAGRFDDWALDIAHRRPFVATVEDGRATAICASVRISKAVHCAGVETHPEFRRRGHAAAAVAAWAQEVRRLGAAPIYSTSWDNLASQGVAARLGLSQVAIDFHIT